MKITQYQEKFLADQRENARALYVKNQSQSGLKVGNRVKILDSVADHAFGWDDVWAEEMNDHIGQIGKITDFSAKGVLIEVGTSNFNYPFFVLEKIKARPIVIGMNTRYFATVCEEGVNLNGQTYSFGNVLRLAQAVKKFQKALE